MHFVHPGAISRSKITITCKKEIRITSCITFISYFLLIIRPIRKVVAIQSLCVSEIVIIFAAAFHPCGQLGQQVEMKNNVIMKERKILAFQLYWTKRKHGLIRLDTSAKDTAFDLVVWYIILPSDAAHVVV